jgi:hypothetical protein
LVTAVFQPEAGRASPCCAAACIDGVTDVTTVTLKDIADRDRRKIDIEPKAAG